MRQSFKSLAEGDDGISLIAATASMWVKVEIYRMECVTMNTSVTRSLAIIASRSLLSGVLSVDRTPVLSGDRTPVLAIARPLNFGTMCWSSC